MTGIFVLADSIDHYRKWKRNQKDGHRKYVYATKNSPKGWGQCSVVFLDGWENNKQYDNEFYKNIVLSLGELDRKFFKMMYNLKKDR